jgi:RNA polymerase sigma-70 factor (ECF subfamily)
MHVDDRVAALLEAGEVDGAATAAIEALGPAVLGYLASMHDEDDARDVFQAWSSDVWRGLPGFRFEATLRAWAFRLAWHASSRFRRDPFQRRAVPLADSAASRLAASIAGQSRLPGGRKDTLRALRLRLAPEDQTLLVLRVDKDMTWEEVAAVLSEAGAPVDAATLRKRFERIKERLAAMAREEGLLE